MDIYASVAKTRNPFQYIVDSYDSKSMACCNIKGGKVVQRCFGEKAINEGEQWDCLQFGVVLWFHAIFMHVFSRMTGPRL